MRYNFAVSLGSRHEAIWTQLYLMHLRISNVLVAVRAQDPKQNIERRQGYGVAEGKMRANSETSITRQYNRRLNIKLLVVGHSGAHNGLIDHSRFRPFMDQSEKHSIKPTSSKGLDRGFESHRSSALLHYYRIQCQSSNLHFFRRIPKFSNHHDPSSPPAEVFLARLPVCS